MLQTISYHTFGLYIQWLETRGVHYALRVITGNVGGPCVMWIFRGNVPYYRGNVPYYRGNVPCYRGNVPYFYGASLVLLALEGSSLKQLS